jgi:hypothetical protein
MAKSSTPTPATELLRPDTSRDYRRDVLPFLAHESDPGPLAEKYIEYVPQEVFYRLLEAAGTASADDLYGLVHWLYHHYVTDVAIEAIMDLGYSVVGYSHDVFMPKLAKPGVVDLRSMPYEEFLKTQHWLRLRSAALVRADHRCQLCYGEDRLEVHHRTYERRGTERDSDVIVLCRTCHAKFHDKAE